MFTFDNMFHLYLIALGLFIYSNIFESIHMLQLNSYMNTRYFRYLWRNKKKIISVKAIIPVLLFIVPWFFCNCYYMYIGISIITLIFALIKTKPAPQKKPLVYTARIKRLMITSAVLLVLVIIMGSYFNYYYAHFIARSYRNNTFYYIGYAILAVFALLPYAVLLISNIINKPIEKFISGLYIRSAKNKLRKRKDLLVVGITGSYGKTSAKYILYQLLKQKYNVCITPGSFNTTLGVVRIVREQLKPSHEIFIAEMGAKRRGDIKEIAKIVKPRMTLITSIGYQHLETFKKTENIISAKFEVAQFMREGGKVFLNGDNEFITNRHIEKDAKFISENKSAVYYGTNADKCHVYADNLSYDARGAKFTLHYKENNNTDENAIGIETKLLGEHNVINITGAAAIALELGVSPQDIKYAAANLKPTEHRLEIKNINNNLTIIDDAYNSNPAGSKYALDVLREFSDKKRVLVTPGMIELGEREYEENRIFGMNAAGSADIVILVGSKITKPIYQGLMESNYNKESIIVVETINEAFAKLHEMCINEKCTALIENDLTDDYL